MKTKAEKIAEAKVLKEKLEKLTGSKVTLIKETKEKISDTVDRILQEHNPNLLKYIKNH